ncbi:alcohol dehydrogenase catalytic domain-containing protein [Chitinophaga sancti]|uniref:alcohol dehydrogenase catalytic domain-containing protein n=1 Tax=Chitinophaga sancti TaxID=1004 RepID=UPI003F7B27DE
MKAAVFHHPDKISFDTVADPILEKDTYLLLKVTSTAICGSDLHIYDGFFPQGKDLIMGHEFMGIVEDTGRGVSKFRKGDRIVVPFPIACGQCYFCQHHLPTACEHSNSENYGSEGDILKGKGDPMFGYTDLYGGYSGGQAEYDTKSSLAAGRVIVIDPLNYRLEKA